MIPLEEAQQQILAALVPLGGEEIALVSAYGRVLSKTLVSPIDLPGFDNSSMDGYAVQAADVALANAERPAKLRLIGKVAAGGWFAGRVEPGTCVRIFTGSPMPPGADAVVMQEDTRIELAEAEKVEVLEAVKPFENVRLQGEDVQRGALLVEAGARLSAGKIALLAATGFGAVPVGRRPVTGLLATGNELREPGQELAAGQIYESNRTSLALQVQNAGGISQVYPLVPDQEAATMAALEKAFAECDVVVTSGGVSVGEMDFVKSAFEKLGGRLDFWKVAIRPGRPFVFGRWREKCLFGVPGNPMATLVTFLLLVRPALLRLQGADDVSPLAHPGWLAEPLVNPGGRRHFARVAVDAAGLVRPAGLQESHGISALGSANGLVDVPPQTTLAAGAKVQVIRWD